uniref:Uncharacterized protein n=1 Tax=Myotis myotis TaxID=51298 RepID=A0A7J7VIC5_MYOMY|nr:hypothetical protein mMyoMyo1_008235 [Myotis myotis]
MLRYTSGSLEWTSRGVAEAEGQDLRSLSPGDSVLPPGYGTARAMAPPGYGTARPMAPPGYGTARAMAPPGYGTARPMAPPGYGTARAMAPLGYGTSGLWHLRAMALPGLWHLWAMAPPGCGTARAMGPLGYGTSGLWHCQGYGTSGLWHCQGYGTSGLWHLWAVALPGLWHLWAMAPPGCGTSRLWHCQGYGTSGLWHCQGYGTSRLWHHLGLSQLGHRHFVTWAGSQSSFCLEDPTSCSLSCSSNTSGGQGDSLQFRVITPVGMKDSFPQVKSCRLSCPPGGPAPFSWAGPRLAPGVWTGACLGSRRHHLGLSSGVLHPEFSTASAHTCSLVLFITRGQCMKTCKSRPSFP